MDFAIIYDIVSSKIYIYIEQKFFPDIFVP